MSEETIIYPAQPLPPQEPGGGRKRSIALGVGALVIILVLGATAFAVNLFGRDDDPNPAPVADPTPTTLETPPPAARDGDTTPRPAPATTLAPARPYSRLEGGGDQAASTYPARPQEVGPPTPALPAKDFTWDKVQLSDSGAYINSIQWVGGRYLALGNRYDEFQSSLAAWESADGLNWQEIQLNGDFENANVWQVQFNEYGAIALGDVYPEDARAGFEAEPYYYENSQAVWTSRDGINWTKWSVASELGTDHSFWVSASGIGAPGFVLIVNSENIFQSEPVEMTFGDKVVTIDEYAGKYVVTDSAGNELASGSLDEFYGWDDQVEGQAVWDPDTRDLIVTVPWDVWEVAYGEAYESNGPLGGYAYEPMEVTIEHEGWRITIDEGESTYTVENIATGELVVSASTDDLWRGPSPMVYDSAGNLVLALTWEEFDRAQEEYWRLYERGYEYSQDVHALTSADGVNWAQTQIADDTAEFGFNGVQPSGDGFIAFGYSYDEFGGGPEIWTSPDGQTWTKEADVPGGMQLWNVQRTPDGEFIAMGDSAYGNAVLKSSDGLSWGEALGTRIPEDRDFSEWFNQLATGELGTVVTGSRERYYGYHEDEPPEPLTLAKDGRTLTFDDWEWPPTVTVTDDATGAVLFEFRFEEGSGAPAGVSYDAATGVTTIADGDGNVIFSFSDDEFYGAQNARWDYPDEYEYQLPQATMYFSEDLAEWYEVILDGELFDGYLGQLAVGPDSVVAVYSPHVEYEHALEEEAAASGLEPAYEEPPLFIIVGRPAG